MVDANYCTIGLSRGQHTRPPPVEDVMQDASLMKSLDGDGLRAMLSAGAQVLEVNINALNSLNVL